MLRLTSFSVEPVFFCLSTLALLILLPQPATLETELFYNCIWKILLLENVDAHPYTTTSEAQKRTLIFRSQKNS